MTLDGFKLNLPVKNPIIPNSLTDEALSTYDDRYIPYFETNPSSKEFLVAPWFMQTENDESSGMPDAKFLQTAIRKVIQKKTVPAKFLRRDFPDYFVEYERNETTNRMNRVWTCKHEGCNKRFRKFCSLKDHIRLHKNEAPFPCAYCGRGWSQAGNRDRHQKNASCLRGKKGKILMEKLGIS